MNGNGEAFPRSFSLYLDLMRFLAALAVFLDHLTSFPITGIQDGPRQGLLLIGNYGQSAVTVFFVMSGFVIAYVTTARENSGWTYSVSRVSRLYSVVVPALLLTFAFDLAGQTLHPEFYHIPKILSHAPSVAGYLSSALFLNEYSAFHFGGIAPGSNAPFWSLSFEATYYVVAGLLLFASRRLSVPLAIGLLWLGGSTIVALLPVWALGFGAYRFGAIRLRGIALPLAVVVMTAILILAIPLLLNPIHGDVVGLSLPWGRGQLERDIGKDYATAAAVAVNLVAARSLLVHWPRLLESGAKLIRFLGLSTFPLYATHFPALAFASAVSPFAHSAKLHVVWLCAFLGLLISLMTPVCERLKFNIRYGADRLRALGGRVRHQQMPSGP